MDWQTIIELDRQILAFFNGSDSLFIDGLMLTFTNGTTWIALYLALLYVVVKNNDTMLQIGLVVGCCALCLFFTEFVTEGLVKPAVARPRPGNDPLYMYAVDVVNDKRSLDYSFFSAHAANTFSIAVFFSLLVRSRLLWVALMAYSLLNCWTRLYLGVHYPIDILVGLTWGAIVGSCVYLVYGRVVKPVSFGMTYTSTHYTSTGYLTDDAVIPVSVFLMTLLYAFIRAAII
jgi:undecaprenyl-diphosphatase